MCKWRVCVQAWIYMEWLFHCYPVILCGCDKWCVFQWVYSYFYIFFWVISKITISRCTCQCQPAHQHHDVHHCDYSDIQYQPDNNFNYNFISHIFTSQYYGDHFQDSSHFCNRWAHTSRSSWRFVYVLTCCTILELLVLQ